MRYSLQDNKVGVHLCAVIKRILFIGFAIQTALGLVWMCCNFTKIQDFGRGAFTEGSTFLLYDNIFKFLGKWPPLLYLLQVALAFYAEYHFLRKYVESKIATLGSLAALAFPFAMQCHLAILPYSFMSSLFLLMLSFLLELLGGSRTKAMAKNAKTRIKTVALAAACAVLALALSGVADGSVGKNVSRCSFEAALASRMAWPTLWIDHENWTEELQEITEDVLWEATYCPDNMEILQAAIESQMSDRMAKAYYMQIAQVGWQYHASMIVRQIGWDVLGYMVTPLIFRLQLEGEGYDSYTGRNYEAMRGNTPVLTRYYVEYGCWWFGCSMVLTGLLIAAWLLASTRHQTLDQLQTLQQTQAPARQLAAGHVRWVMSIGLCILASSILTGFLTMRGAGLMDYKCTIAINELWLLGMFLLIGKADGEKVVL